MPTYIGSPANLGQKLQLVFVHYPRETKIRNHNIRILGFRTEQQILWFQIYSIAISKISILPCEIS